MAAPTLAHYLRHMTGVWNRDPRPDADPLAAFALARDEVEFAELVVCHGADVWDACRQLAGSVADAEDAFLAFARTAAPVRPGRVGAWLRTVAGRTALRTRRSARRREAMMRRLQDRVRPGDSARSGASSPTPADVWEELTDLPERYRMPLLLYYQKGKTQAEVAQLAGVSNQEISRRPARACDLIRERLIKQGMVLTGLQAAAALTAVGNAGLVSASAPPGAGRGHHSDRPRDAGRGGGDAGRAAGRGGRREFGGCTGDLARAAGGRAGRRAVGGVAVLRPALEPVAALAPVTSSPATGEPGRDRFGDPLPDGAVARVGTVRLWPGEVSEEKATALSPDNGLV